MRSWRSEAISLVEVLIVPAALATIFPYAALKERPSTEKEVAPAFISYVALDAAAEQSAIRVAKTRWRGDGDAASLRTELAIGELPASEPQPVFPLVEQSHPSVFIVSPGRVAYLPSRAASQPEKLTPVAVESPVPTFSREQMLQIP